MMFRIPTVTKNLLIINLICFIATLVLQVRGIDLADIGGLHFLPICFCMPVLCTSSVTCSGFGCLAA